MNLYFGDVKANSGHATDDMFYTDIAPNHAFYYCAEYGSAPGGFDDVVLEDSAGRKFPIDLDSIPVLIATLERVLELRDYLQQVTDSIADPMIEEAFTENN